MLIVFIFNCWCICGLLLKQAIFMIPTNPPPTFRNPDQWSETFKDFVSQCLIKNPENRATATQLLQVYWFSSLCFYLSPSPTVFASCSLTTDTDVIIIGVTISACTYLSRHHLSFILQHEIITHFSVFTDFNKYLNIFKTFFFF